MLLQLSHLKRLSDLRPRYSAKSAVLKVARQLPTPSVAKVSNLNSPHRKTPRCKPEIWAGSVTPTE